MSVHVLAIVKGAVEGDVYKHFGSLNGFNYHARQAVDLGLVISTENDVVATDAGRVFYAQANLASLPDCRAGAWSDDADYAKERLREYRADPEGFAAGY